MGHAQSGHVWEGLTPTMHARCLAGVVQSHKAHGLNLMDKSTISQNCEEFDFKI